MKIDIVSLFPEMFDGPFGHSIIKRARLSNTLDVNITNPRAYATDKHKLVDDTPYGGGVGMVMKAEPIFLAVEDVIQQKGNCSRRIILMCPSGATFNQQKAIDLAKYEHLILLCGHYEGIDNRVKEHLVDECISIGDYVLTGGELPAMVIVDAVARMIPGVLGSTASAHEDSFYNGLLEHPQYTKPRDFRGLEVPEVLLSGNHHNIGVWRRKQSLKNTYLNRPELLTSAELIPSDKKLLEEIIKEMAGV